MPFADAVLGDPERLSKTEGRRVSQVQC
jgi:hypothetical protein